MTRLVAAILCGFVFLGGAARSSDLPFQFGGPFQLTDHHGQTVTEKSFPDRHLLVYFGYTYCPDICPTDLARLAEALDALSQSALMRVQPLFITVDPARDTPEVMADYVSAFHPTLIGLTGSETAIAAAAKAYRVHRMKVPLPEAGPDEYLVNHTPNAYLIGPDGGFKTLFPHNSDPKFITSVLRKYLNPAS